MLQQVRQSEVSLLPSLISMGPVIDRACSANQGIEVLEWASFDFSGKAMTLYRLIAPETLSAHLEGIGFIMGRGHPSVFWHPGRQVMLLVHGDDYVSAGDEESMTWLEEELAKAYEIQIQKLGTFKDMHQEGKVLNRIIRCTEAGWEIEADPRHAELVMEQLGLTNERGCVTPGVSGTQ